MTAISYGRAGATVRYADAAECRVRLTPSLVTILRICSGSRVARGGARDEIRSFRLAALAIAGLSLAGGATAAAGVLAAAAPPAAAVLTSTVAPPAASTVAPPA
jgi:hypothetical protein